MELLIYDISTPTVNKTNTISTALATLLFGIEFKAGPDFKASAIDVYGSNEALFAEFVDACNGKVSLTLNGSSVPGKTIDIINSQEYANVAELYSALGSDFTFTHVSDDTNNSVWRATFKLAVGNGTIPLGENIGLNLNFESFSNVEFDAVNHISRDMVITVSGVVAPQRATAVYKLKNFTTKTGQVTEIPLNGVFCFAVPAKATKTNHTYIGTGYQQEMLEDERRDWLRTETNDRFNAMGITAPWCDWHVFDSSMMQSIKVTAASVEKCYGFMLEPIV